MYSKGIQLFFILLLALPARAEDTHAPDASASRPEGIGQPQPGPRASDLFRDDQIESFEIRHTDGAVVSYNLFEKNPDIARKITAGARDKEQVAEIRDRIQVQDFVHVKVLAIELRPVASDPARPDLKDALEVYLVGEFGKTQVRKLENGKRVPVLLSKQDFLDGKRQEIKTSIRTERPGAAYKEILQIDNLLEFQLSQDGVNLEKSVTLGTSMVAQGVDNFFGKVLQQYPTSGEYKWLSGTRSAVRHLPDSDLKID